MKTWDLFQNTSEGPKWLYLCELVHTAAAVKAPAEQLTKVNVATVVQDRTGIISVEEDANRSDTIAKQNGEEFIRLQELWTWGFVFAISTLRLARFFVLRNCDPARASCSPEERSYCLARDSAK